MGQVFQEFEGRFGDFISEGNIDELGVVPVCVAPGESAAEHSHVGVEEVMGVKAGRGQFEIEDQWFDVCEGSVGLVKSGEFHAIHNTGDENLEVLAVVNTNVDFDTIQVKSRAEHFSAKASSVGVDPRELAELRGKLASVSELLAEVRGELETLRKASKRTRKGRAA
ncbi:MAG: cupin domain-containing protein [Myxococcales bacterium]|nr:cupin domain-containing protein [Myxococcales bacterium]